MVRPTVRIITSRSIVNEDGSIVTITHINSHSHSNLNYGGYTINTIRNAIEKATKTLRTG